MLKQRIGKKVLYILFPLTMVVWGLVIRQVIQLRQPGNIQGSHSIPGDKPDMEPHISFELSLNYPDPFLGRIPVKAMESSPVRQPAARPLSRPVVLNNPGRPELTYFGMVISGDNKVALVSLEDVLILVREKDMTGRVVIQKIAEDSLKISYNENVFSYSKAQ